MKIDGEFIFMDIFKIAHLFLSTPLFVAVILFLFLTIYYLY